MGHLGSSCLEAGTGVPPNRPQMLRGRHPGKYKVHSRLHPPQVPQAAPQHIGGQSRRAAILLIHCSGLLHPIGAIVFLCEGQQAV